MKLRSFRTASQYCETAQSRCWPGVSFAVCIWSQVCAQSRLKQFEVYRSFCGWSCCRMLVRSLIRHVKLILRSGICSQHLRIRSYTCQTWIVLRLARGKNVTPNKELNCGCNVLPAGTTSVKTAAAFTFFACGARHKHVHVQTAAAITFLLYRCRRFACFSSKVL